MAYKKRNPHKKVEKAKIRLAAMKLIDANKKKMVNYGNAETGDITSDTLGKKYDTYIANLEVYNNLLQQADSMHSTLNQQENEIAADSAVVLDSAPYLFGANSNEVVELGGKKKKERNRPRRKPTATTPPPGKTI